MGNDVRSNILREPLPHEDGNQSSPEETHTLLLQERMLTTVQCVEELDCGNELRVNCKGGIDEEDAHDPCQAIPKQLRADERKDTNSGVGANVVVQILSGENADREGGGRRCGCHDCNGDMLLDVERPRVDEPPEPVIRRLQTFRIRSWEYIFQGFPQNERKDLMVISATRTLTRLEMTAHLQEQLTNGDCLRTEILR